MMAYSSQLIVYRAWSFHRCAWSMSLQWWKSPESVGLLALRRVSLLVASGYTSSILVLKQVTRAGMIRVIQRLLAVIRLRTCALYILHDNTGIHQFVATQYVDTTTNARTNRPAAAQLIAAYCWLLLTAVYTATSAKRETTALHATKPLQQYSCRV